MRPEEGHKNHVIIFGMEHFFSEDRRTELGLFNWRGDTSGQTLLRTFTISRGLIRKRVFIKACSDRKSKTLSK